MTFSQTPRTRVGVIGAGRWGTVIAHTSACSGREVVLYARDAEQAAQIQRTRCNEAQLPELGQLHADVACTNRLQDVAEQCHLIFIALSVTEMRPTVHALGRHVDGSQVIVHAVRGLEPETFATPSQIISEETCVKKIGAMHGPVLVEEVLAGHPSAAVVASLFHEVVDATRKALVSETMRIYSNDDLVGVEAASAAVHLVALALGVERELSLGPATHAVLITRGVAEIGRLCEALGGSAQTASGLAGLGDLLVLSQSEGREVEAGRRLARGESMDEIASSIGHLEVMKAAQTFHRMATKRQVEARITAAIHDMIYHGLTPQAALHRLMTLDQMEE